MKDIPTRVTLAGLFGPGRDEFADLVDTAGDLVYRGLADGGSKWTYLPDGRTDWVTMVVTRLNQNEKWNILYTDRGNRFAFRVISPPTPRDAMSDPDDQSTPSRLSNLIRHITNVRAGCELLGGRLMAAKHEADGFLLIANGQVHDASKFRGIEFEYLNDGAWPKEYSTESETAWFKAAVTQHVSTNPHHPEYWRGISAMPPAYLAECLCDWKARSGEQGTDLWEWVKDKATARFGFDVKSRVYRDLRRLAAMLLDRKFK